MGYHQLYFTPKKCRKYTKKSARVSVGGMRMYDHVSPSFRELIWLKVRQRQWCDICVAVYKSMKGVHPHWLHSFSTVVDVTGSVTRQRNNLVLPGKHTDTGAEAFLVSNLKMGKSLPVGESNAATLSSFKSGLTKNMPGDTR